MSDPLPTNRRRFRFRLRTLLLLPLVFAIGWWWVTWPERTARRFVALLAAGDFAAALAMSDGSESMNQFGKLVPRLKCDFAAPVMQAATWKERILAEQRFRITYKITDNNPSVIDFLHGFVATRGRVKLEVTTTPGSVIIYSVSRLDPNELTAELKSIYEKNPEYQFMAIPQSRSILTRVPAPLETHLRALLTTLDRNPSEAIRDLPSSPKERVRQQKSKDLLDGIKRLPDSD